MRVAAAAMAVMVTAVAGAPGVRAGQAASSSAAPKAVVPPADAALAARILADRDLDKVLELARTTVSGGFNAGSAYPEVWIRDLNTFLEMAVETSGPAPVREALLRFLALQAPDGNVPDAYVPADKGNADYFYRLSPFALGWKAHKNSVETDQETSLVQAARRFVDATGSLSILEETVGGRKAWRRLGDALGWLYRYRFSDKHGLVWGATTADWGDVQPEHPFGIEMDVDTHRAIDIYDNAMLAIAIRDYLAIVGPRTAEKALWEPRLRDLRANVRRVLWDARREKFVPHVFLDGSPFPPGFDESGIYYHGGTAVAVEADLLTPEEALRAYRRMTANAKAAGAKTIGLTIYPAYPDGFFRNPVMVKAYTYQNGGDWDWFGGRMVRQLARLGFLAESYEALRPMAARVVRDGGFFEWYSVDGAPQGARGYRGAAGVLAAAVKELRGQAEKIKAGTRS